MTRSLTEVTGSSAKSMDQSGGRQRSRARRRRMRRIGKEMRQTAVGGKLKEMGKKGKNDVAIIRRLEDDEEARIGGEVGGFVPKEIGEGEREGSGKVVENAKGKERRSRIGRP